MNKVHLIGLLAGEPTARDTATTKITQLRLVTDRPRIRDGKVQKDPDTDYTLIQANLAQKLRQSGVPLHILRLADRCTPTRIANRG